MAGGLVHIFNLKAQWFPQNLAVFGTGSYIEMATTYQQPSEYVFWAPGGQNGGSSSGTSRRRSVVPAESSRVFEAKTRFGPVWGVRNALWETAEGHWEKLCCRAIDAKGKITKILVFPWVAPKGPFWPFLGPGRSRADPKTPFGRHAKVADNNTITDGGSTAPLYC